MTKSEELHAITFGSRAVAAKGMRTFDEPIAPDRNSSNPLSLRRLQVVIDPTIRAYSFPLGTAGNFKKPGVADIFT